MTYNTHGCVGVDRVRSPERIAEVIAAHEPDIVGLQEMDVGRARSEYKDQPAVIADALGMHRYFYPGIRFKHGRYGNAVLSRTPLDLVTAGELPGWLGRRVRSAIWLSMKINGERLHFINTHIGLQRPERMRQVKAFLGPEWLGGLKEDAPVVLTLDLNTGPRGKAYKMLAERLRNARNSKSRQVPGATFPSPLPVRHLDHIFVGGPLRVLRVEVPKNRLVKRASDHRPVIADIEYP